ncbi:hypothetical protein GCM10023321_72420 [Pseudonocardia eucalypti]|uniref:Uncharacterized protein n=1 Tax=Pseudonocardia eucalypti TaxID=648755 RepID=A0ABP9R798_9PSEU
MDYPYAAKALSYERARKFGVELNIQEMRAKLDHVSERCFIPFVSVDRIDSPSQIAVKLDQAITAAPDAYDDEPDKAVFKERFERLRESLLRFSRKYMKLFEHYNFLESELSEL